MPYFASTARFETSAYDADNIEKAYLLWTFLAFNF